MSLRHLPLAAFTPVGLGCSLSGHEAIGIVDQLRTRLITVYDYDFQVAGTGAVRQSSRLVPHRVSLILLEEDRGPR
jgi:hypothetical protein